MNGKGWINLRGRGGSLHVTPFRDVSVHTRTADCRCRPRLDDEPGMRLALYVHNSFDRREAHESDFAEGDE